MTTVATESRMVMGALHCARRGVPIFPLKPRGKKPLTTHGFHDATTEETIIRKWFEETPDANIGIPTGPSSGLFVLDVDFDHGGAGSLSALEGEYGKLPDTVKVHTGGGGSHYYFRYPKDVEIRNSAGKLGAGLDVRGDGGYIVAPPSIHPNGRVYAVVSEIRKPAEAPRWLIEKIIETQKKPPAAPISDRILVGQRNETLTSLAGTMRRRGMSREGMIAALLAENQRCVDAGGNSAPLPQEEIDAIVDSIQQYPVGERIKNSGLDHCRR